jgi:hypothetical protein
MFVGALFTTAKKKWKQHKYTSTDECIKKKYGTYTQWNTTGHIKGEVLSFVTT